MAWPLLSSVFGDEVLATGSAALKLRGKGLEWEGVLLEGWGWSGDKCSAFILRCRVIIQTEISAAFPFHIEGELGSDATV
jgi:hypothetical protein